MVPPSGAIALFEDTLKTRHREQQHISYSAQDLHAWLDGLVRGEGSRARRARAFSAADTRPPVPPSPAQPQVGALVFDAKLQAYVPYDKEWLKAQTLAALQRAAQGGGGGGGARRR